MDRWGQGFGTCVHVGKERWMLRLGGHVLFEATFKFHPNIEARKKLEQVRL